jgi:hypothetical protein
MNVEDVFIDQGIALIGPTAFSIFCYIRKECKGRETKILIKKMAKRLHFSKKTVILKIKELKNLHLVSIKKVLEDNRKCLYFKDKKITEKFLGGELFTPLKQKNPQYWLENSIKLTGAEILALSTTIYTTNNILYTNNKYIKYTSSRNKRKINFYIMKKLLEHKRFNNEFYLKRNYKFETKEKEVIRGFIKNFPTLEKIDHYLEWFLKNKAGKISGLNLGLVLLHTMQEEYFLKNKKTDFVKKTKKDQSNKNFEKKASQSKIKILKLILKKQYEKEFTGFDKLEKPILKKHYQKGKIFKNKKTNKWEIVDDYERVQ